ncbi:uncharacterized protein LOC120430359 isoform X2 [Culex pipiens pallens]|uniref:uncharacterized protein LOC120430359 isoform X2 n=1 Tax=Culex pipiens pallens TaxID=42434 RepID=UPI0022AA3054|nr:uncharacterized protein LOC120430359 isoform X2 [Culex pipiens pallens]
MFQLPLLFNLILLISAIPPKPPTPQVTALFGPRNNFICNAVVLAKGRLLTTANCVVFINNGTQRLGAPEDFHVALNATDIERFVGMRSGKPARRRIADKLRTRGGEKFDNKFSNEVFSNKFDRDELDYLLKGLFTYDVGKNLYGSFVNVTNLMVHPGYSGTFKNDLAILEVSDSKVFQEIFPPMRLNEDLGFNRVVQVYGWGDIARESSRNMTYALKIVEMYLLPPARCARQVGNLFLPSQHLCLKPKGTETICLVKDSLEPQSSWTVPCLASSNLGILNVTLTHRSWASVSDPSLTSWA